MGSPFVDRREAEKISHFSLTSYELLTKVDVDGFHIPCTSRRNTLESVKSTVVLDLTVVQNSSEALGARLQGYSVASPGALLYTNVYNVSSIYIPLRGVVYKGAFQSTSTWIWFFFQILI